MNNQKQLIFLFVFLFNMCYTYSQIKIRYHYDYDTTISDNANFRNGWIDTFSIDLRHFRIKLNELTDSICVEYSQNGKWIFNTTCNVMDQFATKEIDCNYDGYYDIYSQKQGWDFINYYIPSQNIFSKQYQLPGDGTTCIDSTNKIYCNYRYPYNACNNYISQLFKFKNSIPIILYQLIGETDCETGQIKSIKLYKYDVKSNKYLLRQTLKPFRGNEFDYVKFWKNEYFRLLN